MADIKDISTPDLLKSISLFGDVNDYVDSMTQALMRYRQGYYVELKDDFEDDPNLAVNNRRAYY